MSNVKPFPDIGKIKDEASEWVVRIHGYTYKTNRGLPKDVTDELTAWMEQSSEHRHQFLKMLGGWEAMGMLEDLADILPLAELKDRQRAASAAFVSIKSWFYGGVATACMLGVLVWTSYFAAGTSQYITEVGQQTSLALEDGSSIQLNTDTKVSIDFSEDLRVVRLEQGEAHFEVAKDEERPFVVFAGDGMVMAVGTAFNVRHQIDDSVNVVVSEGTVKVFSGVTIRDQEPLLLIDTATRPMPESIEISATEEREYFRELVLDAGESARYSQARVVKEALEEEKVLEVLAWKEGVLVFQGETLKEALLEIARYTDRKLIIVDPVIGESSVGGRFKTDDIDALAYSLALGLDIDATTAEDGSILFSAR